MTDVTTQPALSIQATLLSSYMAFPSSKALTSQSDCILIVTVTKVEALMVLEVFSKSAGESRRPTGNKTYYDLGVHGGVPVFMVQSEMGTATPSGALLTVRQAIQDLRAQAVIMCGIAFGLHPDKQELGDILVAKQLGCYEPQKIDLRRGQIPRGDRATCADRLLDRFRSGDIDWKGAKTHFGLVLSGEKLVNDPAFRDLLLEAEPEAIGGEMEGAGLYAAARDAKVDWILVKAICDWADGTKNDEAQLLAASNAAEFVLYVLRLGGWSGHEQLYKTYPDTGCIPYAKHIAVEYVGDREKDYEAELQYKNVIGIWGRPGTGRTWVGAKLALKWEKEGFSFASHSGPPDRHFGLNVNRLRGFTV